MVKKKKQKQETREAYLQVRITPSEKQEIEEIAEAIQEPASRIARQALKRQLRDIREQLAKGEVVSI